MYIINFQIKLNFSKYLVLNEINYFKIYYKDSGDDTETNQDEKLAVLAKEISIISNSISSHEPKRDNRKTEPIEKTKPDCVQKDQHKFDLKKLRLNNIFKNTSQVDVEKYAFYLTNQNPLSSKLIDEVNGRWVIEFENNIGFFYLK